MATNQEVQKARGEYLQGMMTFKEAAKSVNMSPLEFAAAIHVINCQLAAQFGLANDVSLAVLGCGVRNV